MSETIDHSAQELPEPPEYTLEMLQGNISHWETQLAYAMHAVHVARTELNSLYQERSVREIAERTRLK